MPLPMLFMRTAMLALNTAPKLKGKSAICKHYFCTVHDKTCVLTNGS